MSVDRYVRNSNSSKRGGSDGRPAGRHINPLRALPPYGWYENTIRYIYIYIYIFVFSYIFFLFVFFFFFRRVIAKPHFANLGNVLDWYTTATARRTVPPVFLLPILSRKCPLLRAIPTKWGYTRSDNTGNSKRELAARPAGWHRRLPRAHG